MRHLKPANCGAGHIVAICAVLLAMRTASSYGQGGVLPRPDGRPRDPQSNLTVYEGVGVGELQLGDPSENVEQVFGQAEGGAEHFRQYTKMGLRVQMCEAKVLRLSFDKVFPGKLYTSGLGIGDTLEDLERAYGRILERREVQDQNAWTLDRVLLVRRDGPQCKDGEAAKLHYYDLGMHFSFDEQGRIRAFGLSKRTGYALRPAEERVPSDARRPELPNAASQTRRPGDSSAGGPTAEESPFIAEPVYEGTGFADLRLNDPVERVEQILGPASGGCDHALRYKTGRFTVRLRAGKVDGFCFRRGFLGRLAGSGLGIGDTLQDVLRFYGEPLAVRDVDNLCAWNLDRTLLVLTEAPKCPEAPAAEICYNRQGLCFEFDADDLVLGFGLFVPEPEPSRDVPGE